MRITARWLPLLAIACLPLLSCATIASGKYEQISVNSTPGEATATLRCEERPDGGEGVTPIVFKIRRNAGNCHLTIRKDGFEDLTMLIEQGVNPVYWTNMILSPAVAGSLYAVALSDQSQVVGFGLVAIGAFGIFGTDFLTGAVHTHRPSRVDAVLKPK